MYIGSQPFTKASYNPIEVIASKDQTTFNVSYSPNFVDVLLNGVRLSKTDYVANDGVSIVLNDPILEDNTTVTFLVWGTFQTADAVATGGGSQTVIGEKTFEDFRLLEDINGDKFIKDSSGLTLATFDSEGKLNANNGLSYVGGAILVDGLSSTFTNSTNNINATGIGVGVEIGDVIQISGSVNNNGEFTVEVITDVNNVIVNQAHAGGTTSKSLVDETATVTVKLLCKWYLAPTGLGQGWVNVAGNRAAGVTYINDTGKQIFVSILEAGADDAYLYIDGIIIDNAFGGAGFDIGLQAIVPNGSTYLFTGTKNGWSELR